MTTSAITTDVERLKARLKTIWMAGDYDIFSRYLEDSAREFYERLPVSPGGTLLDVACGSGQLALMAAKDGLKVTGVDIATNLVARARARARTAGLRVRFEEADAEALPFADAQFDAVTSLIGAMFAPRPGSRRSGAAARLQARWNHCNGELDAAGIRRPVVQSRVEVHRAIRHALAGLVGRRSHGTRKVGAGALGSPPDQAALYILVFISAGRRGGALSALLWTYSPSVCGP